MIYLFKKHHNTEDERTDYGKSYQKFQQPTQKRFFLLLYRRRRVLILPDRFIILGRLLNRDLNRLLITAAVSVPEHPGTAVVAEFSVIGKLSSAVCTVDSHDVFPPIQNKGEYMA